MKTKVIETYSIETQSCKQGEFDVDLNSSSPEQSSDVESFEKVGYFLEFLDSETNKEEHECE